MAICSLVSEDAAAIHHTLWYLDSWCRGPRDGVRVWATDTHPFSLYVFSSFCYGKRSSLSILQLDTQVVKVADFGVARVQAQTGIMTAETGTYRWMAPEVS